MKTILLASSLFLVACGSAANKELADAIDPNHSTTTVAPAAATVVPSITTTESTTQTKTTTITGYPSLNVADVPSLPVCDTSTQGALAYVQEDQDFESCDTGKWSVIQIQGPQGVAGATGAQGTQGATGATGAQGIRGSNGENIVRKVSCDITQFTTGGASFRAEVMYTRFDFSSGDVYVEAAVLSSTNQDYSYTTAQYFPANQANQDAPMVFYWDSNNASWRAIWTIDWDPSTGNATANYSTVSQSEISVLGGTTATQTFPTCTVTNY